MVLAKSAVGQIPVLELDDGTCLSESTAILFYLAEGSALLPPDRLARTRVLQWMCFEQTLGRRHRDRQPGPHRVSRLSAWERAAPELLS